MQTVMTENIGFGFRKGPKQFELLKSNWIESNWKNSRQNAHVQCAFQSKRSAGQLSAAAACAPS